MNQDFTIYAYTYDEKPSRIVNLEDAYKLVREGTYLTQDDVKNVVKKLRVVNTQLKEATQKLREDLKEELKEELPDFEFSDDFKEIENQFTKFLKEELKEFQTSKQYETNLKVCYKIKDKKDKLKKQLPGFTFQSKFENVRSESANFEYTQLLCIDIDKVEDKSIEQLKQDFKDWEFTKLLFTSPSSDGLKAVFDVNTTAEQHKDVYRCFMYFLAEKFNIDSNIDSSTLDLARLCYLSYDPAIYYNAEAPEINANELLEKYKHLLPAKKTAKQSTSNKHNLDIAEVEEKIKYITEQVETQNIIFLENNNNDNSSTHIRLQIQASIYNTLGVDGWQYFLRLLKVNFTDWTTEKEEKYKDRYFKNQFTEYSYKTLFYHAIKHGIHFKESEHEASFDSIEFIENELKKENDFIYNTILERIEYKKKKDKKYKILTEREITSWYIYFKKYKYQIVKNEKVITKKLNIDKSLFFDLVENKSFAKDTNVITMTLENLHTQYKDEISEDYEELNKYISCFESEDNFLTQQYIIDWLGGIIKNLTTDNYYDRMLILQGNKQGQGKTYAITRALLGIFKTYLKVGYSWSDNKDDLIYLSEKLVIFDDELQTSRKRDVDNIKATLSLTHTDIRKAYKRFAEQKNRIATFAGTTNNTQMLTDTTGNRRFMITSIKDIDRAKINSINYEKLWAEVWQKFYINKEKSSLSDAQIEKVNNDKYRSIGLHEDALLECFDFSKIEDRKAVDNNIKLTKKTLIQVVNQLTDRTLKEDNANRAQFNAVLESKGIEEIYTKVKDKTKRMYYLKIHDSMLAKMNRLDSHNTTIIEDVETLNNLNQNISKDYLDRLAETKVKELRKKS